MAPVDTNVADLRSQLASIRRRRNSLVAQRAGAALLSAATIGAALVIGTALRGTPGAFVVAATLAIGLVAGCTAYFGWLTWVDWMSLPDAARLADRVAALDDRLLTLLAVASCSPAPPLRALLADQVRESRARWNLDSVAPRRFSPWLALLPLAFAIFAATTFYARPPAAAATRQIPPRVAPLAAAPLGASAITPEARGPRGGDAPRTSGSAPAAPQGGPGIAGSEARAGASAASGAAAGGPGHAPSPDGAIDHWRAVLQNTFGNQQDTGAGHSPTAGTRPIAGGTASGGRSADAPREAANPPSPDSQRAAIAPQSVAREAHGNGRSGAASSGTGGLLASASSPAPTTDSDASTVSIRLHAISGAAANQPAPQRGARFPQDSISTRRPDEALPPLAADQVADAPVRPLAVSPEHEALLRRVFSRE